MNRALYSLSLASGEDDFQAAIQALCEGLGFERYNATLRVCGTQQRSVAIKVLENMPRKLRAAKHQLPRTTISRDPCLAHFERSTAPLMTDLTLYSAAGAGEIWEVMAPYGYEVGLNASVRIHPRVRFYLSFDGSAKLTNPVRHLNWVQRIATEASSTAERLFLGQLRAESLQGMSLTNREIEVLRWSMEGKTSAEIGIILGTTESTVNFHTRNVIDKLGVSNKLSAAVKAMRLGYLE